MASDVRFPPIALIRRLSFAYPEFRLLEAVAISVARSAQGQPSTQTDKEMGAGISSRRPGLFGHPGFRRDKAYAALGSAAFA